jgi:hypothetical protein
LYFHISVIKGLKVKSYIEVQNEFLGRLRMLEKKYPANENTGAELNAEEKKKYDLKGQEEEYEILDFDKNPSASHFDQLKNHIIKKAEDASNDKKTFEELVKDICYEKGYGFKSGLKIKSAQNEAAIFRTI